MRKTEGSLTIEASIAMVVFIMFFMAFLTIGGYSETQSRVKHSLNQTAITISARNNQMTKLNKAGEKIINTSKLEESICDLVKIFDKEAADKLKKEWGNSYSASGIDEKEVLAIFAYYYFTSNDESDRSFDILNQKSYDDLKEEFKKNGIEIIDLKDKNGGTSFIDDNSYLTINIKYKIKTPFNFNGFFEGFTDFEFEDSVMIRLIN